MLLDPGIALGRYPVTAQIDDRARDPKLDRDVALNMLPEPMRAVTS